MALSENPAFSHIRRDERATYLYAETARGYSPGRTNRQSSDEVRSTRMERLMRQLGIQGAHLHKQWNHPAEQAGHCGTRFGRPSLQRRRAEQAVGRGSDLHQTLQGILYLAVVVDVFSRKVVGWQMADDHRLGAECLRDGIVAPRGGPGPADP